MSSQPVTAPPPAPPALPPALRPAGSPNGSPSHAPSHPPAPSRRRRGLLLAVALLALLGGAAGVIGYLVKTGALFKPAPRADLLLHTVHRQPLQLTVVERGALESADNREVVCRVRAGTKTNALTIKWVIDDGTQVKKDQLLMEIDDSALQDSLKAEKILLDQARAASVAAEENYKIVVSQNTSEIETAKIVIQLADLDLEKYLKGDYEQAKKDVDNRILLARADLGLQKDRLAWTERMVKMKYMSPTQEQSEVSRYKRLEVTR